ncbi:MAG: UDP-N-acetylmuramyl-tripeptide synthetase [Candidatus Kaiserbacteria bacterium]|nr:UDP-N-acetylmuramyl-tripeptide synthetase [Candidatus Kaiserbacteria bacterium]
MAMLGAVMLGFPSKKIIVIGVTGTKGKSSTVEIINAIFEEAGYRTALTNSIRFKVADSTEANTTRMSMPGRMFIQDFLSRAVYAQCTVAILEMTSEGARQYRHRGIALDALVFTNLAPEHIESHGSFERYADAKYELGRQLERSHKRPRTIVANADDAQSGRYLALSVENKIPFSLSAQEPFQASERGGSFTLDGVTMTTKLPGEFSLKNALAAAMIAQAFGISTEIIQRALAKITTIPGRGERIEEGQDFSVVVDYAHTPDSLKALYEAYKTPASTAQPSSSRKLICVLGSTGGGRDVWKRPVMGGIADSYCDELILTNEDPYDEDPQKIVAMLAKGMTRTPTIIMDRREAIALALSHAKAGDAVLISGKGTDPCICGPNGSKIPWSDSLVAREELRKLAIKT